MPDIVVKATISRDHKLSADVPEDVPAGEFEVIVKVSSRRNGEESQRDRILASFERAASARRSEPTKAELDRQIQEERDSWE